MSGHKRATITITRDEYDRLKEARESFKTVPEIPPSMEMDLFNRRRDAVENSVFELEQRHKQYQNMLDGLNKNVRQVEKANADALLQLQTSTYMEIQQQSGVIWNRIEKLIADQTQQLNTAIQAHQNQNQEALYQLSIELDQISKNEQKKREAASEWLSNNIQMFNFIIENYACDFFLPGQIDKIRYQIEIVVENIENNSYEAALSGAQQIHFALSDMRLELERLHSAWHLLYMDTWDVILRLLSQAVESVDIPGIDLNGELLPYTLHVEDWVPKELTDLIRDISRFRDHLDREGNTLTIETLREYREKDLPEFARRLEDILTRARINAINAQLRVNIADFVIHALQHQGFEPTQTGYCATTGSQLAYEVKFANYEGNEVVVQIQPNGAEVGDNELHLESLDQQIRSEDELENRWFYLSHSLEEAGLSIGPYVREDRSPYQTPGRKSQNRQQISQHKIRGEGD